MSIEGIGPSRIGWVRPRGGKAAASGFSVAQEAEAAPSAPAMPLNASMLSLQEVDDEPPRDRAARRHGRSVLAALAALQRQLLGGGGGKEALERLTRLVAETPSDVSPALAATLDAVLLRARVELARYDRM